MQSVITHLYADLKVSIADIEGVVILAQVSYTTNCQAQRCFGKVNVAFNLMATVNVSI